MGQASRLGLEGEAGLLDAVSRVEREGCGQG